jgi:cytochrome c oxidase subunit 1
VGIGVFASEVLGMGDTALDISIHDTYFVVARAHLVLATELFCLGCAAIYWAFSRILHRPLNMVLGRLHAVLTCVGLLSIYFPVFMISATTAPRRSYEYTEFEPMEGSDSIVNIDLVVTCLAASFILGQVILLVNVIRTLVRRPGA